MIQGAELVREFAPSDGWPKCFCSVCGSALWSRHPTESGVFSVRLGTLDAGHDVRPQYRQFVAYAAGWEPLPDDGLPRYEERPAG